jgi:hypothetical protein
MASRRDIRIINRTAMERLSREEIELHRGEYALLVDGEIESYHATNAEALEAAFEKYRNGEFSVKRVEAPLIEVALSKRRATSFKAPSSRHQ